MAPDLNSFYNFDEMTDDDLYDVVMQHLNEQPNVDAGSIEVRVRDGHVTLAGRVATDGEVQVAEKVVAEVMGIDTFTNELVVDELVRGDMPEAADDAAAYDGELDAQLGEGNEQHSDTAAHLVEDLEGEMYGTHDAGAAAQEGQAYEPPDHPVADGYGSRESH